MTHILEHTQPTMTLQRSIDLFVKSFFAYKSMFIVVSTRYEALK